VLDVAAARRVSWEQLLGHPEVVERAVRRGPVGVMAFHGGLEAATAEIAVAAAAASGASLYLVVQPAHLRWHVPSHEVDPARSERLSSWLAHVRLAVAVHGYGRPRQPRRVLVGGRSRAPAEVVARHLAAALPELAVVTELDDMPPELRGLHPANPVNRPAGGGVQVELPPSARDPLLLPAAPRRVAAALAAAVTVLAAQD
jgi:phage replication-related protein YjqB (UPF0714/DUF867 family)